MKNKNISYMDSVHRDGRIWSFSIMALMLLYPVAICLIFGVFPDEKAAKAAYDKLPADMQKFICEPISENYEYFI